MASSPRECASLIRAKRSHECVWVMPFLACWKSEISFFNLATAKLKLLILHVVKRGNTIRFKIEFANPKSFGYSACHAHAYEHLNVCESLCVSKPVSVHRFRTLAAISRYYHLQKPVRPHAYPRISSSSSTLYATQMFDFSQHGHGILILVRFKLTREDDGGGGSHNSEEGAIDGVVAAHFRRHFALFVVCFLGYKWWEIEILVRFAAAVVIAL